MLAFYFPHIRDLFDIKIFVNASPETCIYRRIIRNMLKFKQTPEYIGDYYLKCARHREREYCLPTEKFANYIINNETTYLDQLNPIKDYIAKKIVE